MEYANKILQIIRMIINVFYGVYRSVILWFGGYHANIVANAPLMALCHSLADKRQKVQKHC